MPIGATRVFHVNVNCSDLGRSLAFYRDLLGLVPTTHTAPPAQPGAAFGMPSAQWDAWILTGERGYEDVALDLLEWKTPPPTGRPDPFAARLGLARVGLTTRDLEDRSERLRAAGVDGLGAPHPVELRGRGAGRAVVALDPDGTQVELAVGDRDGIAFVVVHCSDLDASVRFYVDTVGLRARAPLGPVESPGADLGLDDDPRERAAVLDDGRPGGGFHLVLVEPRRQPPPDPPYPVANHLGIFRLAFSTGQIERDHAELVRAGVRCWSPPARLAMGPGLPDLRALLFSDPDGATLELIESPAD